MPRRRSSRSCRSFWVARGRNVQSGGDFWSYGMVADRTSPGSNCFYLELACWIEPNRPVKPNLDPARLDPSDSLTDRLTQTVDCRCICRSICLRLVMNVELEFKINGSQYHGLPDIARI